MFISLSSGVIRFHNGHSCFTSQFYLANTRPWSGPKPAVDFPKQPAEGFMWGWCGETNPIWQRPLAVNSLNFRPIISYPDLAQTQQTSNRTQQVLVVARQWQWTSSTQPPLVCVCVCLNLISDRGRTLQLECEVCGLVMRKFTEQWLDWQPFSFNTHTQFALCDRVESELWHLLKKPKPKDQWFWLAKFN